ncbi:hypothetical protein EVAR_81825_1 [Eumeta japonica]|uniref:Uncharacterized protein n=1 Tax=Eumeta variegata TaxID=151549 RepID=A0A4C1XRM0_EUMVA|nr:hypothetical protein EVAR_81825_1 [Eumeta japonica]
MQGENAPSTETEFSDRADASTNIIKRDLCYKCVHSSHPQTHSLIVSSVDFKNSGEQVIDKIREALNTDIKIDRVRKCTRCLGFGHSKDICKKKEALRSFCGSFHEWEKYPDKLQGKTPTLEVIEDSQLLGDTEATAVLVTGSLKLGIVSVSPLSSEANLHTKIQHEEGEVVGVLLAIQKCTLIRGINDLGLAKDDPLFTTVELQLVLRPQNPEKAPGSHELTSDICRAVIHSVERIFLTRKLSKRSLAQKECTESIQAIPTTIRTKEGILKCAEEGRPGFRLVALFKDCNIERLRISFCCTTGSRSISISPGLAVLLNSSTLKTSIKRKVFDALPLVEVRGMFVIVIFGGPGFEGAITPRTISVDAMLVFFETGEVVDRLQYIKASEFHEVMVNEDRGENLSYLLQRDSTNVAYPDSVSRRCEE